MRSMVLWRDILFKWLKIIVFCVVVLTDESNMILNPCHSSAPPNTVPKFALCEYLLIGLLERYLFYPSYQNANPFPP